MVRVSPVARKSKVLSGALNVVAIDPLVLIVLSVLTEVVSADASTAKFGPLGSVAPPDQVIDSRLALAVLKLKWVKVNSPAGVTSNVLLPVVWSSSMTVGTSMVPGLVRVVLMVRGGGAGAF